LTAPGHAHYPLVDYFNNGATMATVNYSVPDEVKRIFNETFAGRNKSAIIAELMVQAVEEERRRERRAGAIGRLLARRPRRPVVAEAVVRDARDELRRWP
jgi:hypothetical protein